MIAIARPSCPNEPALRAGNYKHPDNKRALVQASFDKCMYCEAKISATHYGDIEHIRPKAVFPHLEFSWENLGYVCARCNGKKRDQFDEATPFVNPYEENPSDHIVAVGALLQPKQGSERGEITITGIGLNRNSLIERRQEKIDKIERSIAACFRTSNTQLKENALAELKKEANADKDYSLCVSSQLATHQIS